MVARKLTDFSSEERGRIRQLRQSGQRPAELAKIFDTSESTIRKIYQMEVFR